MKLLLLLAYSATLFLVRTWLGLGLCALAFAATAALSRIPLRRFLSLLAPVYVLVGFTIAANGLVWDASAGFPVRVDAPGFAYGCFVAVRIVLLVLASLAVTFSTVSTDLTDALGCFMRPLRRLGVPVDDIATVFSLALRFIPVTAEELARVHDAQWSRAASFGEGSLWKRLRAWQTVFIPLLVGLFRRADTLAVAMDARCYGMPGVRRTLLDRRRWDARSTTTLAAGLAACAALSVFL